MAVAGDVAKLTVSATYLGQMCQNVFFYRIQDAPTETWYEGLAFEFLAEVLDAIREVQATQYVYTGISIVNLFNAAELYEEPLAVTGKLTAAANTLLPSYVSLSFKLLRSNTFVRNGRKQIGGLPEVLIDGNSLAAGYAGQVASIDVALAEVLNPGLGADLFAPVIVGRVPYTTSEGRDAYRLPESQAEMGTNWAQINLAQFVRPSTMNSRKVGHGI